MSDNNDKKPGSPSMNWPGQNPPHSDRPTGQPVGRQMEDPLAELDRIVSQDFRQNPDQSGPSGVVSNDDLRLLEEELLRELRGAQEDASRGFRPTSCTCRARASRSGTCCSGRACLHEPGRILWLRLKVKQLCLLLRCLLLRLRLICMPIARQRVPFRRELRGCAALDSNRQRLRSLCHLLPPCLPPSAIPKVPRQPQVLMTGVVSFMVRHLKLPSQSLWLPPMVVCLAGASLDICEKTLLRPVEAMVS